MDDSTCREFFSQTANPYQRRYEALRARLGFDKLARTAGYPGSNMIPADAALLSLLTLKGKRVHRVT